MQNIFIDLKPLGDIRELTWVRSWLSDMENSQCLLRVRNPYPNYLSIDLHKGPGHEWDGFKIGIKKEKTGNFGEVLVSYDYYGGHTYIPNNRMFINTNKNGEKLVDHLNQLDTIGKLEFTAEFLKEAFAKNPVKLD
jgi:hypothetical protein